MLYVKAADLVDSVNTCLARDADLIPLSATYNANYRTNIIVCSGLLDSGYAESIA